MKKRILAILLAVVMVVSLLPAMAFADDVVTTADDEIVESEEPTETGTPDGAETPTEPAETPEGTETPTEPAETPEGTETPTEPAEPTDGTETPTEPAETPDGTETPTEPAETPDGTETPTEPAETPDGTETPTEPAEPETPAITFTDVPDWCSAAVDWAVDKGVTNGTGDNKFSPSDICKNTEILTMLWRAAGKPAAKAASPFTVASYYQDAVDWAYEEGMIDDDTIPDAHCTRANALSYIWQVFSSPSVEGETGFPDVSADAACASAVIWGVSNGITNGYTDGTFGPSTVCSRGEIVTFLHRAYVEDARLPVPA